MVWHYWTSTQWSVSIYSCRVRGGFETTQSSKAMKEEWLVGMLLIDHLSWSYWFDGVFNCLACLWDTTLWQLRIVVLVMRQWANAYSIEHFVMHVCVCVCVCVCMCACVRAYETIGASWIFFRPCYKVKYCQWTTKICKTSLLFNFLPMPIA